MKTIVLVPLPRSHYFYNLFPFSSQLCQTSVALRSHAHRLTDLQQSGCTGRLLWKINLPEDNTCQLRSPYFYTGRPGYRLSLTLELAGFRNNDEIYSSIYVNLEKGDYDDELKFPFEGVSFLIFSSFIYYKIYNLRMNRKEAYQMSIKKRCCQLTCLCCLNYFKFRDVGLFDLNYMGDQSN